MIQNFFQPKSIAVIGASHHPEKLGYQILKNLVDSGYKGNLFPINPDATAILNLKTYRTVEEVESFIDLALISVKAEVVPIIFDDLAKKGIKNAIIFTAGFDEVGKIDLQSKIEELAKLSHIRVLGPNCLGIISPVNNVNASFAANFPKVGETAVLSQSGALLTSLLDWAKKNNLGFSHCVSLGNKMDLSELDFLEFFKEDSNTKVIGLYLESFVNGTKFKELASQISQNKPIILLKPGKTQQAKMAVTSHTGAMAGADEGTNAALRQSGVIRANTIEDFYDLLKGFSSHKLPQGPELAIITNAGGPGVIATDIAVEEGLVISSLTEESKNKLQSLLPSTTSIKNPIDVVGDALAERFEVAIKAAVADKIQDAILVIVTPQAMTEIEKTAQLIVQISKRSHKPIFASFIGGSRVEEGIKILSDNNIPHFEFPENAVTTLKQLVWYMGKRQLMKLNTKPIFIPIDQEDKEIAEKIICNSSHIKNKALTDIEAFEIAKRFHIPVAKTLKVASREELITQFSTLNLPIVMKVASNNIEHKTEVKGVVKNINSLAEALTTFEQLSKLSGEIILQSQIENGVEIIIGAKKDPDFGHLIMFGMGGIYTEVLNDINFAITPLTNFDALELVRGTKVYKILEGTRGESKKDLNGVIYTLIAVSTLLTTFPQITELDINPLIVQEERSLAVDIKIKL